MLSRLSAAEAKVVKICSGVSDHLLVLHQCINVLAAVSDAQVPGESVPQTMIHSSLGQQSEHF